MTTPAMIHLTSAHGAPGVTTAAMLLSAAWRDGVVVEADPSGGMIAARHDLGSEPGLMTLASALRHGPADVDVDDHAQRLPGGCRVVVAPPSGDHVAAALRRLAGAEVADSLRALAGRVVVDAGRARPGDVRHELMGTADLVVWVCRCDLAELAVVRQRLATCGGDRVVLVGDDPYRMDEVSGALGGVPVSVIPRDERATAVVTAGAPRRRLRRSRIPAAIAELARVLDDDLAARARRSSFVGDGSGTSIAGGSARAAADGSARAVAGGSTGVEPDRHRASDRTADREALT